MYAYLIIPWELDVLILDLVADAVESATTYTHLGIEMSEPIGHGHGPLNHLHSTNSLSVPR